MTKVEKAKAALWGQLVDSGELHEEDANVLLDNLVGAAKEEGSGETMDKVRKSIVIRYYPAGFHGDTLEPLQCVSSSLPYSPAEQFRRIERELAYIAGKAFDAGPHKTKDGGLEISYPPLPASYGDSLPVKETTCNG